MNASEHGAGKYDCKRPPTPSALSSALMVGLHFKANIRGGG